MSEKPRRKKVSPVKKPTQKTSPKKSSVEKTDKIDMKKLLGLGLLAGGSALTAKLISNRLDNKKSNNSSFDNTEEPFDPTKEQIIKSMSYKLEKEREQNKKLVKQIEACNKEIIRQRGVIKSRPSLRRESILRSALNRFKFKNTKNN